jgi:hypothetical protein
MHWHEVERPKRGVGLSKSNTTSKLLASALRTATTVARSFKLGVGFASSNFCPFTTLAVVSKRPPCALATRVKRRSARIFQARFRSPPELAFEAARRPICLPVHRAETPHAIPRVPSPLRCILPSFGTGLRSHSIDRSRPFFRNSQLALFSEHPLAAGNGTPPNAIQVRESLYAFSRNRCFDEDSHAFVFTFCRHPVRILDSFLYQNRSRLLL